MAVATRIIGLVVICNQFKGALTQYSPDIPTLVPIVQGQAIYNVGDWVAYTDTPLSLYKGKKTVKGMICALEDVTSRTDLKDGQEIPDDEAAPSDWGL